MRLFVTIVNFDLLLFWHPNIVGLPIIFNRSYSRYENDLNTNYNLSILNILIASIKMQEEPLL